MEIKHLVVEMLTISLNFSFYHYPGNSFFMDLTSFNHWGFKYSGQGLGGVSRQISSLKKKSLKSTSVMEVVELKEGHFD